MPSMRLASSIILTRGPETDPEVYLVERSPKLRFFGGYWAFPGGTIMEEDYHKDADSVDAAFTRCALRELFEETGILVSPLKHQLSDEDKKQLRNELIQGASLDGWGQLLNAEPLVLDTFKPVCSITTPSSSPVRYETQFMQVQMPDGEEPTIEIGELVAGRFYRPSEAVDAWISGDILIAPPVLFLLRLLAEHDFPTFRKTADIITQGFENGVLHPMHFTPGIFTAPLKTPTLPPATTTNTLLVGNETIFVIDPATPEQDEQLRLFAKMNELIKDGKKFEAILLTHHHVDHIGAVNAVSQKYHLPVRAHPLTYDRIPNGFHPGEPLNEGDKIDLGTSPDGQAGWHLSVIHTPGHADDHLCFMDSRYHAAIVGDMLSTISTILIDPPEGHMHTYIRSLERLLDYPIKMLYPAHGPTHRDGHEVIRYFLKHRQEREQTIIDTLESEPQTLGELLPTVYSDVTQSTYPIASRSLLAGLIKLEEDGVCVKNQRGWSLRT